MITFLVALAVIVGVAVVIAQGCGHFGSSNIIDRDAQRQQAELSAMFGRMSHHR
ncbi:hypothetical protein ACFQZZ_14050 [Nocardia sp. GCM10030253]|uniref:hypothetical protein n=1 Tax=Nocardia sp. GCM10030253 TaxID=3273404 RepID=UPI0036392F89